MGRPLNKKYFGNRNIGSTGTGDNYGIGGEGIASISWSTVGAFMGTSNVNAITIPDLPAPTLPDGVQATWTMEFEVESVTTGAGKTNLAVGDTFAWDPSGADPIPGMVANAVFSVTATGASRGDSMTLANIPDDTQTIVLDKVAGSGTATTFTVDIFWRVKESTVTITEKGSGYTGAETFTFTKPGSTTGTVPAGTIVLTADTGNVGSATYQENAIVAYAYVSGNSLVADIKKQVSGRRYKVETSEGTLTCKLVTDGAANAVGEMTITATDANGNTYYVSKLTAHKATLVRLVDDGSDNDWVYATGAAAPWSFAAASGTTVQIANA
jgi:hypothetical protein